MKSLQVVVALDSSESAGGRYQEMAFLMNMLPIFRFHVFFTLYQGFELFITAGGTCFVHIFSPFKNYFNRRWRVIVDCLKCSGLFFHLDKDFSFDNSSYLASPSTLFKMNNPQHGQNEEHEPIISGFETPPLLE
ncbi:unnamed protein product [Cuscuta epithymum]|uniref:Uncharacterized protein n=1 Tax=Cuscuta epithymum TaxID=186058 RepID=A0AAV0FS98_9ASTE|nr:unnamed protein product [Cuscuta epithymum]